LFLFVKLLHYLINATIIPTWPSRPLGLNFFFCEVPLFLKVLSMNGILVIFSIFIFVGGLALMSLLKEMSFCKIICLVLDRLRFNSLSWGDDDIEFNILFFWVVQERCGQMAWSFKLTLELVRESFLVGGRRRSSILSYSWIVEDGRSWSLKNHIFHA